MEGIREEDHIQHEVQHEEKQEEKTTSQEGTGTWFVRKLGYVSTKDMDLQLALERNKHMDKECREVNRRLEKLKKTKEHLMSHRDTLLTENATAKEEKMKIEMELQVTLERNKYLEKECREIRERLEKLEKKQEDLKSHRETLSTEKRKIEMELQVTLERNKSLEKECREIRERLDKLEQKQEKLQELSQKQEAQVKKLTEEINQKNTEKERADKNMENLKDEIKKKDNENRTDTENLKTQIDRLTKENTNLLGEVTFLKKTTLPVTGFKAQSNCTLLSIFPLSTYIKNYHTVETNYGGHFNPVTGRYTIPVDGKYHVTFSHDHQYGNLELHHVKVSDKSDTTICDNFSSPFNKGVIQATHEGVMCRGDTLYLLGGCSTGPDIDNVTVRFSVSYLG